MSNIDILDASGPGPFPPLQKALDLRPELKTLAIARAGRENPAMFEGFLLAMRETRPMYYRLVLCNMSKDDGNDLYKAGKFPEARAKYTKAAKMVLGEQFEFPVPPRKVKNETYMQLVWQEMMDVVACFNNMAQCYIREGNLEQVCLSLLHHKRDVIIIRREACKLDERKDLVNLEANTVNCEYRLWNGSKRLP